MANGAKAIFHKFVETREAYLRSRLRLPACSGLDGPATIYFLTPDFDTPAGGIRVIYRHVDILNSVGIPAYVLHQQKEFRCTWFEHDTRVTSIGESRMKRSDIIVVPEVDLDLVPRLPSGTHYVIFNQNSHLSWERAANRSSLLYGPGRGLKGVVTVSRHNQEMLRFVFPDCPVHRVHLSIDPQIFHPGSGERPRRLAYMPRRCRDNARQVIEMLRARDALDGWDVVALDGLTHGEVAEQLRTTRIFLAFTDQEGFGLPAAEAMACGNYVIGNHGFGGREFFRPEFSTAIDAGDVLGFARAVEAAIESDRRDPIWCVGRGRKASDFILKEYSQTREVRDVARLYAAFLASAVSAAEAAE